MNRHLKAGLIASAWVAVSQFVVVGSLWGDQRLSINDPTVWFSAIASAAVIFPPMFAIVMGILEKTP